MRSIKFAKHKILLIPLSMLTVTLIAGYFLSHMPLGVSATTGDVSLRVKDTCSMNGNVTTDDSNMLNGQEREGFHVLSLTTYCNDNAGFSIYAVGYSGDLEGSTDLTGVTTGLTISTADWADRNTGDNATKSIYSLKIEKDNTSYLPGNISILNGFTNYLAVPSTNTKVASYSSNTDTTTGSTINASYAVKVANLQAADTYTGKVKYTMVHPSSNSATGFTFDDAFQLAGKTRVSGTSYFAMQDMNAAICNKVTTPLTTDAASTPQAQLIDIRDNKVYWVAKLMDGKCWMTQNLDLDLDSNVALTSADTDLNSVTSWTPANSTINNASKAMNTYPNNISGWVSDWNDSNNTPSSVDAGYKYILPIEKSAPGAGEWNDQPYDTVYNSLAECQAAASDPSKNSFGLACDGHTSVGNYYNFAAANATNDISSTLASIGKEDVQNVDLPDSICPAGWRLPKDNSDSSKNEFAVLLGSANYNVTSSFNPSGLNAIRKAPLYFVRSGYVIGGTLNDVGVSILAWSSTISGATYGYDLYFNSSDIGLAGSHDRLDGFPVRCVANDSMQSFDQDAASSLAINESLQLRDVRDGKEYWVTKLADGNVWMTQNLDLDLDSTVALTNADTDLNSVTSWTPVRSTIDSTSYGNITTCSSEAGSGTGCWGQTNTGFTSVSGTNLWDNDPNTPYSVNPGYRYMIPKILDTPNPDGQWYANGDTFANCSTQDTNCGGQGHYMIGNYYNFAAANATNSVESTVGHTVTDSDANFVMPNSICPKGWRMPKGQSSSNDFTTLFTKYNIVGDGAMAFNYQGLNAIRRDPLYFVRSGSVHGGTLSRAGSDSNVWSSTISAASYGRNLDFDGTGLYPASNYHPSHGFAVRCLLRTK